MDEIQNLDPSEVYGYIFATKVDGNLYPCEFQKGYTPDFSTVTRFIEFKEEFTEFVRTKSWENVIGLEVLDQLTPLDMTEVEVGDVGTVMVESSLLKGCNPYRQTAWRFEREGGTPRVCQDGRVAHGTLPDGRHLKIQSKFKRLESIEQVQEVLQEYDLLS